jgi:hypothetical protein
MPQFADEEAVMDEAKVRRSARSHRTLDGGHEAELLMLQDMGDD